MKVYAATVRTKTYLWKLLENGKSDIKFKMWILQLIGDTLTPTLLQKTKFGREKGKSRHTSIYYTLHVHELTHDQLICQVSVFWSRIVQLLQLLIWYYTGLRPLSIPTIRSTFVVSLEQIVSEYHPCIQSMSPGVKFIRQRKNLKYWMIMHDNRT